MNTLQLENVVTQDKYLKNSFIGVFPLDLIPKSINKLPASLIVNTDPSWKKGEHWVCFYINVDNSIEYFDSYGLPPLKYEMFTFFENNGDTHSYNTKQLQGISSNACGHYCILYLISKSRGKNLVDMTNIVNNKYPGEKDDEIKHFIIRAFNVKPVRNQYGLGKLCQCCKSLNNCCNMF